MKNAEPLILSNRTITTSLPAFVMGIINATPDSFYDESRVFTISSAVSVALKMIEDGADILDIGGESSRPGSQYVSEEEELSRVVAVVKEIRRNTDCPISIDTRRKNVIKACFDEGADILNDISAMEDDSEIIPWVASVKIPVILMHKRGNPDIMNKNTLYTDVFDEVNKYLLSRVEIAISNGVDESKIIIDPGIGFGKAVEDNSILIKRCGELCGGRFPVLMALSRKKCIGEITGRDVTDRLAGTLAANMASVIAGASLVRVHDVAQTVDMLRVAKKFG